MIDAWAMKYHVTAPLSFAPGTRLGLSDAQAARRTHALQADSPGFYITTAQVQFKAGETIAYEGVVPKHLADQVMPEGAEEVAMAPAAPPAVIAAPAAAAAKPTRAKAKPFGR